MTCVLCISCHYETTTEFKLLKQCYVFSVHFGQGSWLHLCGMFRPLPSKADIAVNPKILKNAKKHEEPEGKIRT